MAQNHIFGKKPEIHIDTVIAAFEEVIKAHGATDVQQMQNPTIIERIYEIQTKGAIIARFVPQNGPKFTMETSDNVSALADVCIMYLGFNEYSPEYLSMVSEVQNALSGTYCVNTF